MNGLDPRAVGDSGAAIRMSLPHLSLLAPMHLLAWVANYRDPRGRRRWIPRDTRKWAEAALAAINVAIAKTHKSPLTTLTRFKPSTIMGACRGRRQ